MSNGPRNTIEKFRIEYEKLRRSLDYSLSREEEHILTIGELKDQLRHANDKLQERSTIVSGLQNRIAEMDSEKQKLTKSAIYSKQREANTKDLINEMKERVRALESEIYKMGSSPNKETIQIELHNGPSRLKQLPADGSPYDQWKQIHAVWTSESKNESEPRNKSKKKSRNPRTSYEYYVATNNPLHAHEIALAKTPMEKATKQYKYKF